MARWRPPITSVRWDPVGRMVTPPASRFLSRGRYTPRLRIQGENSAGLVRGFCFCGCLRLTKGPGGSYLAGFAPGHLFSGSAERLRYVFIGLFILLRCVRSMVCLGAQYFPAVFHLVKGPTDTGISRWHFMPPSHGGSGDFLISRLLLRREKIAGPMSCVCRAMPAFAGRSGDLSLF